MNTYPMNKITGITRVRNEEVIIKDVLDHVSGLVDDIYVYDDCSTDRTPEICEQHPAVKKVIRGKKWVTTPRERNEAEGSLRNIVLNEARKDNPDWIYYFDADEFADFNGIDFTADAYRLRLFDFYITPEDADKDWKSRKWIGPEYRDILMLWRNDPRVKFWQREPTIPYTNIQNAGWVKHYGKAVSIKQWEDTCDYYINYRGGNFLRGWTEKWKARKGNAIHTESDFGNELITWEERDKGFKLVDKTSNSMV